MMSKAYDAIWIGGGASGRFGAVFQKGLGGNPLIVEQVELGGQCPINRCAFESYVWDQASMADMMRLCSGISWYPKVDLSDITMAKAVKTYREVAHPASAEGLLIQTNKQLGVDVEFGEAKIIDKNAVEVNGKVYEGKALVIASGSRPTIPDVPGVSLPGVMTYVDHPLITKDPKKLVVIGGGNIGIGKAAMFRAFGTEVTIIEKYKIMPEWDTELRKFVLDFLRVRGIRIVEGADLKKIKGNGRVESVVAEVDGKILEYPCDAVMLSIGLTPNSEIAKPLGVKTGQNNEILIDEGCRTSVPGIYAVGDVAGRPFLMSIARKRGMVAAKNMMGIDAKMNYAFVPKHIYLPPLEATMVGLTEEEARKNHTIAIVKVPSGQMPVNDLEPEEFRPGLAHRSLPQYGRVSTLKFFFYGKDWHGFQKAIIDAESRKFLGFHHVGDGGKTSFQYLSYLLQIGWTVDQMAELHEVFLNGEHFVQLTRLIAANKDAKGLSRLS